MVIGVLKSRGQSGMGQDQDDGVFIPITTAQKKVMGITFPDQVKMVMLQAIDTDATYSSQDEIRQLLRQRHGLGANKEDDFIIMNLTQMMEMMENSTKIMTILLGSIASIFSSCRRYRDYEYYVGFRYRTYSRDWYLYGYWC